MPPRCWPSWAFPTSRRWSRRTGRPSGCSDMAARPRAGSGGVDRRCRGAAHLPGMLAAISILPVLGVPVESKMLRGVDSLLSIVQMPRGVPVGTLAIGSSGAANAAILAAAILAPEVSGDPRGPGPVPPGADRCRGRVADMSIVPAADQHRRNGDALFPPASLGVIGSGQLGRMFIQAAQRMGYRAGVLSATEDAPAAQVAHWTVIGPPDHLPRIAGVRRSGRGGDRRVRERLGPRAAVAGPTTAGPSRLADALGLPEPAPREEIPGPARHSPCSLAAGPRCDAELDEAVATLGSAADPQDGRLGLRRQGAGPGRPGDRRAGAWASLGRAPCVAEGWVDFAAEVSVVVARGDDGRAVCYPVGLNRHERHILDCTLMPAPGRADRRPGGARPGPGRGPGAGHRRRADRRVLPDRRRPAARQRDRPAPHNSGHLTIEAAVTSQFEQQVRALCGLPLGPTDLVMPAAMVNLLGDLWTRPGASRAGTPRCEPTRASSSTSTASGRPRPAERWAT